MSLGLRLSSTIVSIALLTFTTLGTAASALDLKETPGLAERVGKDLPPVAERVPAEPLVVDLEAAGREIGTSGGEINTLIGRSKDVRLINVWGYARLVGYTEDLVLVPDLLKDLVSEDDRRFTLHLRKGHKWSDGAPFTSEDIRFWYEDIALNQELQPAGLPAFMLAGGKPPGSTPGRRARFAIGWAIASAPDPEIRCALRGRLLTQRAAPSFSMFVI